MKVFVSVIHLNSFLLFVLRHFLSTLFNRSSILHEGVYSDICVVLNKGD